MVQFDETKVSLVQEYADILATLPKSKPFELLYVDLEQIVRVSDTKLVLETIAILETPAATEVLAPHELNLAASFVKTCMVTAFPDTR